MEFTHAQPWIVKSIKQRTLLNAWQRLATDAGRIPALNEFQPEELTGELPDTIFYDVVHDTDPPRFLITKSGERLRESFGFSGVGRFIDESMDPKLWAITQVIYLKCIETRRPVYSQFRIDDVKGREVKYERLTLPFVSGDDVNALIASIKAFRWDGAYELKDLMLPRGAEPVYELRAVIDAPNPADPGFSDTLEV
ncbi:MAG: hypothetical protein A4S14_00210 [Proteobacteria bacterium SG_bin9]|nr:MAG: hypothetical protein A4S14_00210 [Proteobacteria bacterium SG_bin9]